MKVNILNCDEVGLKNIIRSAVRLTIAHTCQPKNVEITVKIVDKAEIHELNKRTRGVDKVTDVLSYPNLNLKAGEIVGEPQLGINSFDGTNVYLGDCALCLDVAKLQAEENSKTLESEVRKLVVHSVLHLLGYDHIADEDYLIMHKKEKEILGENDGEL